MRKWLFTHDGGERECRMAPGGSTQRPPRHQVIGRVGREIAEQPLPLPLLRRVPSAKGLRIDAGLRGPLGGTLPPVVAAVPCLPCMHCREGRRVWRWSRSGGGTGRQTQPSIANTCSVRWAGRRCPGWTRSRS